MVYRVVYAAMMFTLAVVALSIAAALFGVMVSVSTAWFGTFLLIRHHTHASQVWPLTTLSRLVHRISNPNHNQGGALVVVAACCPCIALVCASARPRNRQSIFEAISFCVW